MIPDQAGIVLLCDSLRIPPRLGYEIHLVRLASALSRYVPVTVLAYREGVVEIPRDSSSLRWILLEGTPGGGAKVAYRSHALRHLRDAVRVPTGSLVWVRGVSTAALLAPAMGELRRSPSRLRFAYDAASFLQLEVRTGFLGLRDRALAALETRLWQQFDTVRTLGPAMRDFLLDRGVGSEKIIVAPAGCRIPPGQLADRTWSRRALYVGSERVWQGLPQLLRAMELVLEQNPEVTLTVAGASHSAGGPENVEFLGRIAPEQAMELYRTHDLLVVPRLRSPLTEVVLPMKVVEALPSGIPILATDLRPIRDVVGGGGAIFVSEPAPRFLAQAILEAFQDPDRLRDLSRWNRERAEAFTWSRIAEGLVETLF